MVCSASCVQQKEGVQLGQLTEEGGGGLWGRGNPLTGRLVVQALLLQLLLQGPQVAFQYQASSSNRAVATTRVAHFFSICHKTKFMVSDLRYQSRLFLLETHVAQAGRQSSEMKAVTLRPHGPDTAAFCHSGSCKQPVA